MLGNDGLLRFFEAVFARMTATKVRLIKSGISMAVGNSGIHSVPVHRIIVRQVPTAYPSSALTIYTELSHSVVGLVQLNAAPSTLTIGAPTHSVTITTIKLAFKPKFLNISIPY